MSDNGFRFGDWQIDPDSNTLRNDGASATVEPKAMDVLRYLCRHPGAVIPPEELLQACWGNAELGDNPIHKAITQLRRALGDSASEPRYIETVRKRGYRAIAPVIATEDALEGSWQQGSPFRGLESFQESHAAIFFGRMQATAQLRELVLKQASDGCAMALVLGPSGSGKTSLVRAGLLPGLMASRTGSGEPVALACTLYMDCADLADGNLFQALAAVLMDAEVGGKLLFAGENAEGLGRWLESSDAQAIAGSLAEASGRIKIGLFVDRLEAIFRAPGVTDEIRARFIAVLEHLALSKAVLVMLACRNDFYPEVIALPALMALKSRGGHFDLNPPDGAEIAQMVRMPAKAAGLKFEIDPATGAALDDVLCDAARGSPDALPLLQYCLDELYRQRAEDGALQLAVFRQLGGIDGAIAVRAEQVVSALSASQTAALSVVLSLIVDVTEEQGAVTARRAAWSALPTAEARELVQALVEARLFISELAGNVPSFGMAHEALLRRWPRVSDWIEKHRHLLQAGCVINKEAERWLTAGRPRDLLLPAGIRMNHAQEVLKNNAVMLSGYGIEYVNNSLKRIKFTERVRLFTILTITILALLAAILGIFARKAQTEAENRRADAEGLLSYMLGEFVDRLRPLGKLELLDNISSKALAYMTTSETTSNSETALIQRVKSLHLIAEVNRSRGKIHDAITALHTARLILKKLDEISPFQRDTLKELGTNSFWLGQLSIDQGDFKKAENYFLEYRARSDRLHESDITNPEFKLEQSYSHNNLGGLYLKLGRLTDAASELEVAISLKRSASSGRTNSSESDAELANSISFLASTKARLGRLSEAMELYKEEERLLEPLNRSSQNMQWTYRFATTLWRQGELLISLGKPDEAYEKLSESEKVMGTLILRDASNLNWKLHFYGIQIKKIEASPHNDYRKMLEEADHIESQLEIMSQSLSKRHEPQRLISKALRAKATIYLKLSDVNLAQKSLEKSFAILQDIYPEPDESESSRIEYAVGMLIQADIEKIKNDKTKMQSTCRHVQKILDPIAENTFDYRILLPQIRSYSCTDNISLVSKQIQKLNHMKFRDERFLALPPPQTTKGNL